MDWEAETYSCAASCGWSNLWCQLRLLFNMVAGRMEHLPPTASSALWSGFWLPSDRSMGDGARGKHVSSKVPRSLEADRNRNRPGLAQLAGRLAEARSPLPGC